jgi:hypothetical protein
MIKENVNISMLRVVYHSIIVSFNILFSAKLNKRAFMKIPKMKGIE